MKFTVMQYESEHQVCIIVALYGRAEQSRPLNKFAVQEQVVGSFTKSTWILLPKSNPTV